MGKFASCEAKPDGLFVTTNCLYPSFEPVGVYIVGYGEGFIIHDNADAARLSWMYGTEERSFKRIAAHSALTFGCQAKGTQIQCEVVSADWLWSGVATVANASADAARTAVGKYRLAKETNLVARTKAIFDRASWKPNTKLDYPFPGSSGKTHIFDLAVLSGGATALIDAVTPHHNSIAAKYLAFSDTSSQPGVYKYALYEGELSAEDKSLLSNVADLVSYEAIAGTDGRFILQ
ncbi:MAG: hypothetical protein ACSHW1_14605 [Yoonia sp.]|uniref:hypothetical protein n=1 Tax=Yoonia sp. TaxID=2212373 RepID=UPI003EF3AA84